ncbi:MAG: hypothetical protein HQ582_25910, partial [Planctomycetes bacterium]|nr:hypothetical protein [Planctomycetota bacterium]
MHCNCPRPTTSLQGTMRWLAGSFAFLAFALTVGGLSAESMREQVEADWRQQDECRMAQIREPGTVRFVETEIEWEGVKSDDRMRVPKASPPTVDGRLDDACWQQSVRIPAAHRDMPGIMLLHDRRHLHLGVSLPTHAESSFQ